MRRFAIIFAVLTYCIPVLAGEKTAKVYLSELLALIDQADQMVVYSDTFKHESVIYKSSNRKDFDDLKQAITLKPHGGPGMCACIDQPEIVLTKDGKEIAAVWNHEGSAIGSSVWDGEWESRDPERWLHWFDQRGMGPISRFMYGHDAAVLKQAAIDEKKWNAAMPRSLKPLWKQALSQTGPPPAQLDVKPLSTALAKQYPDKPQRIGVLFQWYGSGAGPWSGYPAYEEVAEKLLLQYSTADLVSACTQQSLNEAQAEGAARIFASWGFRQERPSDGALIPAQLKRKLLEHSLTSKDEDKIERAKKAFQE